MGELRPMSLTETVQSSVRAPLAGLRRFRRARVEREAEATFYAGMGAPLSCANQERLLQAAREGKLPRRRLTAG